MNGGREKGVEPEASSLLDVNWETLGKREVFSEQLFTQKLFERHFDLHFHFFFMLLEQHRANGETDTVN